MHPLRRALDDAARGVFPPADGAVRIVECVGRYDAVVSFTGSSIIATSVPEAEVREHLTPGDFGASMDARFLSWMSERLDVAIGCIDAVLVAGHVPDARASVVPVGDQQQHARVARALHHRDDVAVFSDPSGHAVLTIGRGLAGRWETSVEVDPAHRGDGLGRMLAGAARRLIPRDEFVFAQVSPGNAASLRAFLAAGYQPVGSECLLFSS